MKAIQTELWGSFSKVFEAITVDNGSEFSDFAKEEQWGIKVLFAHPYTSWERPQNERHNGLFRAYFPKGVSLEKYCPHTRFAGQKNSLYNGKERGQNQC